MVGFVGCTGHGGSGLVGLKLYGVKGVRVPRLETRITRNNFGYRGLKPELAFGFFGFGSFGFGLEFFGFGLRVICPPIDEG